MFLSLRPFAGQAVLMLALDTAVELPLDEDWRHHQSLLSIEGVARVCCSVVHAKATPEVYHVGIGLRTNITLEGLRRKLNRRGCHLSRDPIVTIL